MHRLSNPIWRRRLARAALVISVWFVGVWADLSRGRTPDFFDVQTAVVNLFFAWVLAELCDTVIGRMPTAQPARLVSMALFGIAFSAVAHALPSFLVGLIQIPLGGLAMLRSVVEGLMFTIRQALVPALVCGAIGGLISALLLPRAVKSQPSNG